MAEECAHECSSCGESGCSDRTAQGPSTIETNSRSNIKHVIGVVSGKGGVGKSLVTSLLASEMQKRGKNVGILDADVTGPSIPKTFGITNPLTADADGILPGQTQSGIKVMSTNLMLPKDDIPVAWRGPVVSNAIRQFYSETNWGDIDYLFVDMPPGTSDVLLTVFQSLPVDGIVTVSAPQELVAMIVGKAVNLAHDMNVELLGLVADVHQADHQREVAVLVEIALDQLRPAALLGFRHARVAVAGQVDEAGASGGEEVDGGRLAGLLRDLRQALAAE